MHESKQEEMRRTVEGYLTVGETEQTNARQMKEEGKEEKNPTRSQNTKMMSSVIS